MRTNKDKKLLIENKDKYIVKEIDGKIELWKKNPKGFYNVICYLNSKSEMDDAILDHLKNKRK